MAPSNICSGTQLSMVVAKVNRAISGLGLGFHYIGLLADGSTMVEHRLTKGPYPQEFPLGFSFDPQMNLRLCLWRRPFYIWPFKSVVRFSTLMASEAHDLLYAGPEDEVEHTFDETPEITVRLKWANPHAVLKSAKNMVARRTRLVDHLGRSRDLIENFAKLVTPASEVHDIAKAVVQGLWNIYNNLTELANWDDKLLDLIEDMTQCLAYVEDIQCFPTLSNYSTTLQTLKPMIHSLGNLVVKYRRSGLTFQREISEYETLQRRFERWKHQFSQGLGVESLKRLGTMHDMMERQEEVLKRHYNDIIAHIRPPKADRERPISGCLAGTRERIFEKIESWIADPGEKNILWIKGFPGSGKTSVAQTLLQKLRQTSNFGASFFFERDGGGSTAPSTMLRTIASDLCRRPVFRNALVADLEKQSIDFTTTSVEDQFRRLVEKPLQHLADELCEDEVLIFVVDALDECGGLGKSRSQDRQDVLTAIQRWSALSPRLRLVVTSRVEEPISEVLAPISTCLDLKTSSSQATRDIRAFLVHEFRKLAKKYCLRDNWPTSEEIQTLAKKAKGLFVWAATLINFVDQPRPQDILLEILSGAINVEGDITDLYKVILQLSFCHGGLPSAKFREEFNYFVGGIITATRPLEKGSPLFTILGVETATTDYICAQLRSVMMENGNQLRFNHQSFVDFLLSETCPSLFRITPGVTMKISLAILNFLNGHLRFDPSRFRSSYRSNSSAGSSSISGTLLYACQSWGDTLSDDGYRDAEIAASLKMFFETKFLFWLEALSLTGHTSCALGQLLAAKKWIGASDLDLSGFITDAISFVEIFHECISKSAPHIYISAMSFTDPSSRISQAYSCVVQPCAFVQVQTAEILRGARDHDIVPANIVYSASGTEVAGTYEGHIDDILSVLITPNSGGYIASAAYDKTIRFWNPTSGAPVLSPFTHEKAVTSLALSKDGMLLVSGSRDCTAAVWDMKTHKKVATFAHDEAVTCVAISPRTTKIITGCKDTTVKFWDISRKKESRTPFRGHTDRVTSVVFLERELALSGSLDGSLYLHHILGHSTVLTRGKPIYSIATAASSRLVVAACYSCVAIWTLSMDNTLGEVVLLAENSDDIKSVAVHGWHVAVAIGKTVEIWDASSKKLILGPLNGHKDIVTSLAFSEDGALLVSGGLDRTIRVWNVAGRAELGGFPDGSRIQTNGWIRGPGPKDDLIIWVPEMHRRRLCWGRTLAVITGKPATHLRVADDLLGRRWFRCFGRKSE
ncbi:hypothetical protein C8R43DRAFT_306957 [Mycena crocata]|nr:hypothetical protein C8R43DRAFT_306957 [Mycena crocata]